MFEFLQYDFMQRALITGLITSVVAPLVGVFLVVRRYSILVDTLSHVSLLGIALGLLFGFNPFLSSTMTAISASIVIEKVRYQSKIYQEAILAMFLSGSLAISLIIISSNPNFNVNLLNILFGSITTVTWSDMFTVLGLSTVLLVLMLKNFKKFFLIAFDEELATVSGLNTKFYNYLLIILAAVTISLAIRIVGVLLISALMVIPVITAMQYRVGFNKTTLLSIFFSVLSVLLGLVSSYYLNWSSGGTIVLVNLLFFFISFSFFRLKKSR